MLFINHTSNATAAKSYFREQLTRSDYYMKDGQEIVGQWHGRGAAVLGLSGPVDRESYFRLCDNQDPHTGEQLTARMKANRRVTYDFTFDAPKSVSLAYELGGDERILEAFRASVRDTMGELEGAMSVRVRKGGQFHDRVTANMVWAEFVHHTTRPLDDGKPDPQLHTHAVAMNVSYDPVEECWKAGEFGAIKRDASYYQAAFHARLGKRLSDLGYAVERDGKSFRLAGVDKTLTDRFSRRSQVIEAEADRRQITDAKQKSKIGRLTRKAKGEEASIGELRFLWKARLSPQEAKLLKDARSKKKAGPAVSAKDAMDYGIEHGFERESVLTDKRLLAEALMHGVGSVAVEDVHAELKRADVIVKDAGGVQYATTRQVYREEVEMVGFARAGRGTCKKLAPEVLALDASLSREQRKAAEAMLHSRDRVIGLRGGAGTGKTRMMQATVAAIEEGGHKVFTFAPSAEASRGVLRSEGFAEADTVERLLIDEKMQERVAGQVLWIDEAGLLSVKDMNRVFNVAKSQHCRVILSGDSRQHSAVGRGDALRLIEQEAGLPFSRLSEVRRQTSAEYREAIAAISQGDASAKDGKTQFQLGIEKLDQIKAIAEIQGEDRLRQIAGDYLDAVSERKQDGSFKTALVVAPTHAEAGKVTDYIRDRLKAEGRIGVAEQGITTLASVNWTAAQRREAVNYEPGLVVQFHQNVKGFKRGEKVNILSRENGIVNVARANGKRAKLPLAEARHFQVYQKGKLALAAGDVLRITQNGYTGETQRTGKAAKSRLNNGAVYGVAGFAANGDIKLSNGFTVPKDYGHLAYGYTSTSHASQGKTVDRVFISMGQDSLVAANREQFYVSVSRGKESVKLYTDDRQAMLDAVRASRARISATELLKATDSPVASQRESRIRRLMQVQRIRRSYEAVRNRAREMYGQVTSRKGEGYEHRI